MSFFQFLKTLFLSFQTSRKQKDQLVAQQIARVNENGQLKKRRNPPPVEENPNPAIQQINQIIDTEQDFQQLKDDLRKLTIDCQNEIDKSKKVLTHLNGINSLPSNPTHSLKQVYQCFTPLQKKFYVSISDSEYEWFLQMIRMKGNPLNEIIKHDHIKQKLLLKNLLTLKPGVWLNDEVCNAYISVLNDFNDTQQLGSIILNTFFYGLIDGNESKLLRITQKSKITKDTRRILIPFNQNNTHWSLFLVDRDSKRIHYYDSLSKSEKTFAIQRINQVVQVWDKHLNNELEIEYESEQSVCPQQTNFYDCGVFMLKNIQLLSRKMHDLNRIYSQESIFYDRVQIGVVLKRGFLSL